MKKPVIWEGVDSGDHAQRDHWTCPGFKQTEASPIRSITFKTAQKSE